MRLSAALLLTLSTFQSSGLSAQIVPEPSVANPRIQTVRWTPNEEFVLTALPNTGLTVMLEPGEEIRRVSLEDPGMLDVRVSAEADSFLVLPRVEPLDSAMLVQTDRRDYRFSVRTAMALTSAYVVTFEYGASLFLEISPAPSAVKIEPNGEVWAYRLRGDRSVRPTKISDDGVRTTIEFGPEQDLPAIFAIGPTGDEQVVNGHMRGGIYVIDRIHDELVFRIDKDKATARRNEQADNG